MNRPYIIYSLSKERTTQKFKQNKVDQIIDSIRIFLDTCTTTNIENPDSIELTAYAAFNNDDPAELLNEIINKTTQHFGEGYKKPIAFHYQSGESHSTSKYSWTLDKDRLQDAIKYIKNISPMPKSNFGPLELFFSYSFKLTNFNPKNELENQEHASIFSIWFSRGKSCSPTIFLPFENADKEFWNYIDTLSKLLPFRLEEKYLRVAHVNKQGDVKSFKKIGRTITIIP